MGTVRWVIGCVALCTLFALGCSKPSSESGEAERLATARQPLTAGELATLGFEGNTWQAVWTSSTLTKSSLHSEGQESLAISNFGYAAVQNIQPLSSDGSPAPAVVGYDVRIPPAAEQVNPYWWGDTQLYISAPSAGIDGYQYLGIVPFTDNVTPDEFYRVEFSLPQWMRTGLDNTNYDDLLFVVAVNTTPGNGTHFIDRFTLGPGTCQPNDDENPCTEDTCNGAGQPIHTPVADGTSCSDGDACNGAETCQEGLCADGTAPLVNDGNPCTEDSCDPEMGVSNDPLPDGTSCADANVCNGAEACSAGSCAAGTPLDTDDGNPCTADSCDPIAGVQNDPSPAGTDCGNGDACDGAETCDGAGACQPGPPPLLDDGNPCTADSCDPSEGVTHTPLAMGTSCADANLCNGTEQCDGAGTCQPGMPLDPSDGNPCTADSCDPSTGVVHTPVAAGTSCADADLCNGNETCDGAGVCVVGTPSEIDDGNPCTADSCDPVTGVAHTPLPAGTSCADGDVCNGAELCDASAVCQPGTPLDPDDDNICTTDSCDPIAGIQNQPTPGASCADGDVCNGDEVCSTSGACQPGTALNSDDGNPCTADSCDPVEGVQNEPVAAGTSCNDNDVCNGMEQCDGAGTCQAGSALDPDDGNPCTADTCDPVDGIQNDPVPAGTSCGDNNVCNGIEVCDVAGVCEAGAPLDPDDGNACTTDSCDPITGIHNDPVPAGTSCSDNDVCNGDETCDTSAICQPGTPPVIDDGNACTVDICDPSAGVSHNPATDGSSCDDGDACSQTDSCQAGTCSGGNPVVCSALDQCHDAGSCDPGTGLCSNPEKPDGTACDDGDACSQTDSCQAGTCSGTDPVLCTALDQCHDVGTCDPGTGFCSTPALPDGTSCDDEDVCTDGDTCASGACIAGTPVDSDDGNPCTADFCDAATGVGHTPVAAGTACADGDACNGDEVCDGAGSCVAGTPPSCDDGDVCTGTETCDPASGCMAGTPPVLDDGNPCTADSCDPVGGVVHDPVAAGTGCDDGNPCNGLDACDAVGTCQAGAPPNVDDGNPCTTDDCDPIGGITHTPIPEGSACNLDACTLGGTCDAIGACIGATPIDYEDGDPCTVDTCDPVTGIRRSTCTEDRSVSSSVYGSMRFLFLGDNPVQQGVDPSDLVPSRMSAVTGRVVDQMGAPIPSARVTVPGHPEFGFTNTQIDGTFQMVVNGSGQMRIAVSKPPYLDVQRQAYVGHRQWVTVPEVALSQPDPVVTTIDLSDTSAPFQIHQASTVSDDDGDRQGTLLLPQGTSATMRLSDGTISPIETLNVRITEFTAGQMGPQRMPAQLPRTSGYTYSFEVNADEAVFAGADSIEFDRPLYYYVENFLGFPAGTVVPVGSYDRERGVWEPEPSGLVLTVVDVSGGAAALDLDGDDLADSDADLEAAGISVEERETLAELYGAGQSLWRVPIHHFTQPVDCNWPYLPEDGEYPPKDDDDGTGGNGGSGGSGGSGGDGGNGGDEPEPPRDPPDPCEKEGSLIECESQVLRETIPVGGTPFTLNYSSARVPGRLDRQKVRIPLSGPSVPATLKRIELAISVAGRTFEYSFPPDANQVFDFFWDGLDSFGRLQQGRQDLEAVVGFVYDAVYATADGFALPPEEEMPVVARQEGALTRTHVKQVGGFDARALGGLGGWTLNVHHSYHPTAEVLQLGDGRQELATPGLAMVEFWPKGPVLDESGDGGPLNEAGLGNSGAIATGPDGSVYIVSDDGVNIRRVSPDGIIDHFAGAGYGADPGYSGDGGPASEASFGGLFDIEVGPDGSVYVATSNHRIRRIDPSGFVTTIAGTGVAGFSGDGGPATEAQLNVPAGIGVGRWGDIYVADRLNYRVRRITPDGTIHTVGGNGGDSLNQSTVVALSAGDSLGRTRDVAEAPDGSFYVSAGWFNFTFDQNAIRHYQADGMVSTALPKRSDFDGCEIDDIDELAVDEAGKLYFASSNCNRIGAVVDGNLQLLARAGFYPNVFTGHQSAHRIFNELNGALSLGPDGLFFTGDASLGSDWYRLYRLIPPLPDFTGDPIVVASTLTGEVYVFDQEGRHLETRTKEGQLRYTFSYGSDGQLEAVVDEAGNQTTVERDAFGAPTRIVGPYGHDTELSLNGDGFLSEVTNPIGDAYALSYGTTGLLEAFEDLRGNASVITYDGQGRLLSDTDASGGALTLSSSGNSSNWVVTTETAEGVTTAFEMTQLADDGYEHVTRNPDGTQSVVTYSEHGRRELKELPNGTIVDTTSDPGERLGMGLPETEEITTLPSGLERVIATDIDLTFDSVGGPFGISVEDTTVAVNGSEWTSTYTASDRRTRRTSPEGRWRQRFEDSGGRLVRQELPNTLPVEFIYDSKGRLETTVQGDRTTARTYFATADDRNGYLQSITDALDQLTTFERDGIGRVLTQTAPDMTQTSFGWDGNSNVTSVMPPGKPAHAQGFTPVNLQSSYTPPTLVDVPQPASTFSYNLDRRPTLTVRPDTLMFENVYDTAGRLDFIDTPSGFIDYSYFGTADPTPGALSGITHPSGVSLDFTYDGHLPTSVTWSGSVNGAITWTYNNDFRVTTETVTTLTDTSQVAFRYDNDGLMTCASATTCPSGTGALNTTFDPLLPRPDSSVSGVVTDQYDYNAYGELASYEAFAGGNLVFKEVMDTPSAPRDDLGRIVEETETLMGATTDYRYEYDLQGRLERVFIDGVLEQEYTYDANGNRLSLTTPEGTSTATYDDQDRLLSYGDFDFTYTANGELLTKTDTSNGDMWAYEYDVRGNLVRVDLPDGRVIEYLVDGGDRCVGKLVDGVLMKQWVWKDQLRIAAELDGSGNLVSRFVYGEKPTTPDLVIQGTEVYRVLSDHLGSVRGLVNIDDANDMPVLLHYDVFGEASGNGLEVIPQGFAGGLYDHDTRVVRYGARNYDPAAGRWISKDSLRFLAGINFFTYAHNDPINWFDPDGFDEEEPGLLESLYYGTKAGLCALFGAFCPPPSPGPDRGFDPGNPGNPDNDGPGGPYRRRPPPQGPDFPECAGLRIQETSKCCRDACNFRDDPTEPDFPGQCVEPQSPQEQCYFECLAENGL